MLVKYPFMAKVLPLVYNDALSYYENICALIEVIKELNRLIVEVEKSSRAYTDAKAEEIREEIAGFEKDIMDIVAQLGEDFASFKDEVRENQESFESEMNDRLSKAVSDLNQAMQEFREEVTNNQQKFESDIINRLEEAVSNLKESQKRFEADIRETINDFRTEFIQYQEELRNEITDFRAEIRNELTVLKYQVTNLLTEFNKYRVQINDYINYRFDEMLKYIDDNIALNMGNKILVYNPVTQRTESLKKTLQDIYDAALVGRLTAREWDSAGLTAEEYDAKGLTAWEYDHYARWYFFRELYFNEMFRELEEWKKNLLNKVEDIDSRVSKRLEEFEAKFRMRNPFTGMVSSIVEVINALADLHRNALTAQKIDDMDRTAQEWDDMECCAYQYDFNSKIALS